MKFGIQSIGVSLRRLGVRGLALILLGWVAAAVSFVVSNSVYFWQASEYGAITQVAAYVGVPAFLIWAVTVFAAFRWYGASGWWGVLAAPLALWTPLRLFGYVLSFALWSGGVGEGP